MGHHYAVDRRKLQRPGLGLDERHPSFVPLRVGRVCRFGIGMVSRAAEQHATFRDT